MNNVEFAKLVFHSICVSIIDLLDSLYPLIISAKGF